MNKRLLFSILCMLSVCIPSWPLTNSENVIKAFADRLANWCETKNFRESEEIEEICSGKISFRASDDFTETLANRYEKISTESYVLDDYINCLKKAIQDDIRIEVANIKDRTSEVSFGRKDLACVSCEFRTTGILVSTSKTLFIINTKDYKICRAKNYTETVDEKGRKRIKVDFSDLEDISTLGITLNHDKHFQAGASIIGQYSWFMCSLDFGVNLDSKKYVVDKMDMNTIIDYERTRTEYDPKMFLTLTPSVFLKYVSLGCGVGWVFLKGKDEHSYLHLTDQLDHYSGGSYTMEDNSCTKFMFRPQLRGYLKLSSSCNMSVGVGYDIVPKMKDLNGYNVSIGFHFDYDDWDSLFSWW